MLLLKVIGLGKFFDRLDYFIYLLFSTFSKCFFLVQRHYFM